MAAPRMLSLSLTDVRRENPPALRAWLGLLRPGMRTLRCDQGELMRLLLEPAISKL